MGNSYLVSTNPAKGYEEVGRVPVSTNEEITNAVKQAHEVFPAWKELPIRERIRYFKKFLELYEKQIEEIAKLQTQEMGKPIKDSISECSNAKDWLEWQLENAPKFLETQILDKFDDYQTELHFEPYGVTASIAPWNYPTYQFFLAVMQQLLVGNTVVFKHSEECPLTSQILVELMNKTSFPKGVFSCIYGNGQVGQQLLEQDVNLIHFTGSSRIGQLVYEAAAKKFIPAVLEMGGSSPAIVFDDANLKNTCDSVYAERFDNCGQICCALKRLVVHENIHDKVVEQLKAIIELQVVSDPLDKNTTMGPLVAKRQLNLLEEQVDDAKAKGATIVAGGERPSELNGAFYKPTLITNTTQDMKVVNEEVFGPVLPVIKFSSEEEAVKIANDTPYGLSAFVYTDDSKRADRVAKKLEAGQISINGCSYFSSHAPFGGYKKSGIGRGDGKYGYYNITQMKVISRPC